MAASVCCVIIGTFEIQLIVDSLSIRAWLLPITSVLLPGTRCRVVASNFASKLGYKQTYAVYLDSLSSSLPRHKADKKNKHNGQ
jgi:hypothetical protein